MVAERNPQIEKAVVKLRRLSADERARDLYERREKGRRDYASVLKFELEKENLKMARKLKGLGVPIDTIMAATKLAREEIEKLKS